MPHNLNPRFGRLCFQAQLDGVADLQAGREAELASHVVARLRAVEEADKEGISPQPSVASKVSGWIYIKLL